MSSATQPTAVEIKSLMVTSNSVVHFLLKSTITFTEINSANFICPFCRCNSSDKSPFGSAVSMQTLLEKHFEVSSGKTENWINPSTPISDQERISPYNVTKN